MAPKKGTKRRSDSPPADVCETKIKKYSTRSCNRKQISYNEIENNDDVDLDNEESNNKVISNSSDDDFVADNNIKSRKTSPITTSQNKRNSKCPASNKDNASCTNKKASLQDPSVYHAPGFKPVNVDINKVKSELNLSDSDSENSETENFSPTVISNKCPENIPTVSPIDVKREDGVCQSTENVKKCDDISINPWMKNLEALKNNLDCEAENKKEILKKESISTPKKGKKPKEPTNKKTKRKKSENLKDDSNELSLTELLKLENVKKEDSESDADENWEKVKSSPKVSENEKELPKSVEITLDLEGFKRKKKGKDIADIIRLRINRIRREIQLDLHQLSLVGLLAHGYLVNKMLCDPTVMATALSIVPSSGFPPSRTDLNYLEKFVKWIAKHFNVAASLKYSHSNPNKEDILNCLSSGKARSVEELVFTCVALCRSLGILSRLILSLQPIKAKVDSSELQPKSVSQKKPKGKIDKSDDEKSEEEVASKKQGKKDAKSEAKTSSDKKKTTTKNRGTTKMKPPANPSVDIENKRTSKSSSSKMGEKMQSQEIQQKNSEPKRNRRKSAEKPVKYKESSLDDTEGESDAVSKRSGTTGKKTSGKSSGDVDIKRELRVSISKLDSNSKLEKQDGTEGESDAIRKRSVTTGKKPPGKSSGEVGTKREPRVSTSKAGSNLPLGKPPHESSEPKRSRRKSAEKPVQYKESSLDDTEGESDVTRKKSASKKQPSPKEKARPSTSAKETQNVKRKSRAKKRLSDPDSSDEFKEPMSDDSEEEETNKNAKKNTPTSSRSQKIISSDSEYDSVLKMKKANNTWMEVYLEQEEQWMSVDIISGQIHCDRHLEQNASDPVLYVVAFNSDLTWKDVTARYASSFLSTTRKQRSHPTWSELLNIHKEKPSARSKAEDESMEKSLTDRPLPTSISEFKNHPLYALQRHLLKFEAIYPPTAIPVGFIRNEPVFARECVKNLHSRETWLKEAKVVRIGEKPYKVVKARPKWDRYSQKVITDQPLELFGDWQIEDYIPPPAENGIVPRNAYGNVELFLPTMLPKGTKHLQIPGLNKIARKLGIDCAPAMTGWDFHGGWSHPVYDGFVVCEEHVDTLMDAWQAANEEEERREREKKEKRVYGNWRRIIRGLLIRERLQAKYFGNLAEEETPSTADVIDVKAVPAGKSSGKGKRSTSNQRKKKT